MSTEARVTFESALDKAIEQAKALGNALGDEILLVRDLRGRIRVVLQGERTRDTEAQEATLNEFRARLTEALGVYGFPPERSVLFANDLTLVEDESVWADRRLVQEKDGLKIFVLDRQITNQDWMRAPLMRKTTNARVTFFGIKGGVGRSTAMVNWAWRLAGQGKMVLVFDLDLESPGVSSTLLPQDCLPDYGIVDWFVEDGVGQGTMVEEAMVATSPLAKGLRGEIRVIPAYGRKTGDYLSKLARCYSSGGSEPCVPWAARLQQMVEGLEMSASPDVAIFDSRAGLQDIAATLVTRMDAEALLFAVGSSQTWTAYSFLFRHWRNHPKIRDFRSRLQMVAGMVPETGREAYLKGFCERSWDVFRELLYDETRPDDVDAFSFDVNDQDAPHYPLPVFWHRALQEFDPARSADGVDGRTAEEALGPFMDQADRLVTRIG